MTQCTDGKMNYFKKYICFVDNIDNKTSLPAVAMHNCTLLNGLWHFRYQLNQHNSVVS